mgnify:FL=1
MKYKFKTVPYEHQLKALKESWNKPSYAYFMEMGTGKSKVLIDNIALLYDRGAINTAVIIAPKGVYLNWLDKEIPNHMPDHVETYIALWKASPTKRKQEALMKLFTEKDKLRILIINVEAFSSQKGKAFTEKFVRSTQCLLAVDESTTIKNPKAARTKNLLKIADHAKFKRILTGFPITKSPMDFYTQFKFLDTHILGYQSFYAFQNHFAEVIQRSIGSHSFREIKSFRNLDELKRLTQAYSYRVLKKECLDLPDKIYNKHYVELTPEQNKLYKQMKKDAMAILDQETITATSVMTQLLRLHTMICGFVKTDQDEVIDIDNNRLDALLELVSFMDGKVIIWANYIHNIERITEALKKVYGGDSVVSYYGSTNLDDRKEAIKLFQSEQEHPRFFVGNQMTAGYGITLTEANNVIYYSNSFDLEKRLQSEDRAHRIGQVNKVTYYDLTAKDTIDEKIVKTLCSKHDLAKQVLGDGYQSWLS